MRSFPVKTAALLLFLVAPVSVLAAVRVFSDGFEAGNTSLWSQSDYHNKCVAVSSSLDGLHGTQSGSYMARCNWNGVVEWNDPASYEALWLPGYDYTSEVFVRFWFRADTDVDAKPGSKFFRIGADGSYHGIDFSEAGKPWQSVWLRTGSEQIGTTFYGGPSMMGDTQWHKAEVYILSDSGAGIIRQWEDDVLINTISGENTTQSTTWESFHLMSNWSSNPGWEHDADNHVYWDDFEIYSDATSGDTATGSMADGTIQVNGMDSVPPAAPSGLGVQ